MDGVIVDFKKDVLGFVIVDFLLTQIFLDRRISKLEWSLASSMNGLKPRRREDVGRLLGQMYTRALIHFVNA